MFYMLAGLLGGCLPVVSLHPFYTKKDVVFDEKLLGTWVDDPNEGDSFWQFVRIDEPNNAYGLVLTDKEGPKGAFVVHLIKLKDRLFLDVYPAEAPWNMEDPNESSLPFNSEFLIPTHTVVRVDSVEPTLKMRLMLETQLKKLLEENPNAIAHALVEERPVLTASTGDLQAFVLKYADDDKLFTDEIVLERRDGE